MSKDILKLYVISFLITIFLGVVVVLLVGFIGIKNPISDYIWVAFGGFLFCLVSYLMTWRIK